jgi:VWFA-related protein
VEPASFRFVGGPDSAQGEPTKSRTPFITLLFDRLGPDGRDRARSGALQLLKNVQDPDTQFSVLQLGERAQLVAGFTSNRESIREAIERATRFVKTNRGGDADPGALAVREAVARDQGEMLTMTANTGRGSDLTGSANLTQVMLNVVTAADVAQRRQSGRTAIPAIQAIAREQLVLPGRKALVYFSESLEVPETMKADCELALAAANLADLSIYAVEVSGLPALNLSQMGTDTNMALGGVPAAGGNSVGFASGTPNSGSLRSLDRLSVSHEAYKNTSRPDFLFDAITSGTGGFLAAKPSELKSALQRIAEETKNYYSISFVPVDVPPDGEFRQLFVRVGQPKLRVQSRSGYFARANGPAQSIVAQTPALLKVLEQDPLPVEFPHDSSVFRLSSRGDGRTYLALVVEAPLRHAQFEDDPATGRLTADLSVLTVVRDEKGALIGEAGREFRVEAAKDLLDDVRGQSRVALETILLSPGQYSLETVIEDKHSHRLGVRKRPFTVEGRPAGLSLSDPAWVARVSPSEPGDQRPFRIGGKLLEPRLNRSLAAGETPAMLFVTVYPEARRELPVTLELQLLREGRVESTTAISQETLPGPRGFAVSLEPDGLTPGDYTVRLVARQGASEATGELQLSVSSPAGAQGAAGGSSVAKPLDASALEGAPPTPEQDQLLELGRKYALSYTRSLPNFICVQTTRRLEDPKGVEDWRQRDEFSEVLTFREGREEYTPLKQQDRTAKQRRRVDMHSHGEFGSLLADLFSPASQAEFRWLQSARVGGRTAHVFAFRIGKEHSQYRVVLKDGSGQHGETCPYQGTVALDEFTGAVLWLDAQVEQIPERFRMRGLRIHVDYGEVTIAGRSYLMPVNAAVTTLYGGRHLVRNEAGFRGFRRFESDSKITFSPTKD